jgi:Protein of unknown function (DUF550)
MASESRMEDKIVTVHVSDHHSIQGSEEYVDTTRALNALQALAGTMFAVEAVELRRLAQMHRQWSDETFGTKAEIGPVGALKHLAKEAQEAAEAPHDIVEYVDCMFLLLDAIHRGGFTMADLTSAGFAKLAVLKTRRYSKVPDGVPSEHDRSAG